MTDQIKPHRYRPSWLHMGDCDVCGHVAESPLHDNPVIVVCNPAPSPGPLWDRAPADAWATTTHIKVTP